MRRARRFVSAAGLLALVACFGWPHRAQAQRAGEIILTQVPVPTDLSGRDLKRFLAKNRTRVLKKQEGATSWDAWVVTRLRRTPPQSLLNRPENGGKIHLVFYEYDKAKHRWTYVNVMNIRYVPAKVLIFQIKITLLDGKREKVFASTKFKLK